MNALITLPQVLRKRIPLLFAAFCLLFLFPFHSQAQEKADDILGIYKATRGGFDAKVLVSRQSDGTYTARVTWLKNPIDPATGKPLTDYRNKDKKLQSRTYDKILLFWGMKYNPKKKIWEGGKVYDPVHGMSANCKVERKSNGDLNVTGSIMMFSETVSWTFLSKE